MAKTCQCKYADGKILTLSEEIGARLRQQRAQAGLTQDQLAEHLGVSKRTQGNYESGASDPPASYLSIAASALGFDVLYIVSGIRTTLKAETLSEAEDSIVQQYRSIPPEDQRAIRRFVKAMADDALKGST
ncbi:helix-turn-helix domain-containing protein [Pseudomonas sp. W4I3]|uniref:helix-turn-helix domain-containing protein n=1 Tax=Pseudomonas sp. W4I3 TaxID=3042294 RepID=UPI00278301C6|nr:helix-turn-helix transcriptional regulator [Pseudomonas sp. W4I3]MDQ0741821.1 transcriptional regulator with XRE-family HTH domain [Pseudomonas sp. W4I3]